MNIKKGDLVKVISGPSTIRGLQAKVVSVDKKSERVFLEGMPFKKKHLKPERSKKNPEGGIIEVPSSVHVSNVMLVLESQNRPVRAGFKLENNKKIRVAKGKGVSGQLL